MSVWLALIRAYVRLHSKRHGLNCCVYRIICRQLCGVTYVYWFLLTWLHPTTNSHRRHKVFAGVCCLTTMFTGFTRSTQFKFNDAFKIKFQRQMKQQNNIICVLRTERLRLTCGYFKRGRSPGQKHWIISLQCCGSLLCTTQINRQHLSYACLHCS